MALNLKKIQTLSITNIIEHKDWPTR